MKAIKQPPPSYDDREFVFCDFLGNELIEGDSAIYARSTGSGAKLSLVLIGKIGKYNKIAKQYYQIVGSSYDWDTYFRLDYSQSGTRCEYVMGIKGIEFQIDKPEFARLFVKQVDYLAANPVSEEEPEEDKS